MRVIAFLKDDITFKNLLPYINKSVEINFSDTQNIAEYLSAANWDYIFTQGDLIKQLSDFDVDSARIINVDFILNGDYAKRNFLAVGLQNNISDFESVIVGDFAALMGFNANEFLVKTANLASKYQDLKISYLWLKQALTAPNNKIKYAIIGLSPYCLRYDLSLTADKWEGLSYYSIFKGQMKFPLSDDVMSALFDENFLNIYELSNDDYAANAEQYADLNFVDPLDEKKLNDRALVQQDVYGVRADIKKWEAEKYFHAAQRNTEIFMDCLKLCREHNVTPIVVKMPVHYFYKTVFSKELYAELETMLYRAKKIESFHLIDAFSWDIADKEEFCHIDILNSIGAKKVTHSVNAIISNMHNTKIKVAIISQGGNLNKVEPVYKALCQRNDVDIYILAVQPREDYTMDRPFDAKDEDFVLSYKSLCCRYGNNPNTTIVKTLTKKGFVKLEDFHFDYVFYIRPYEHLLQPNVTCQTMSRFTKTCYIPYCVAPQEQFVNFTLSHIDFLNNLNFYFLDCEEFAKAAQKAYKTNIENSDQHFLWLGSPEIEEYIKNFESLFEDNLIKKRMSVMWAPRWTDHHLIGGTHFMEYKDNFTLLRKKYPDLKMIVRPHRNLLPTLIQKKTMSEEEVQQYKDTLKDNDIYLDEHDSLKEAFKKSDIMIADITSIMPLYFLTGNPIIYCESGYNLFGYNKMIEPAIYRAETWEEVEKYLIMLLSGEDPLKDERRRIIKEMHKFHNGAAEKIVQTIIDDYYKNKI